MADDTALVRNPRPPQRSRDRAWAEGRAQLLRERELRRRFFAAAPGAGEGDFRRAFPEALAARRRLAAIEGGRL